MAQQKNKQEVKDTQDKLNKSNSAPENKKTADGVNEKAVANHPGWSSVIDTSMLNAIGVKDLQGIMGSTAEMMARQHLLNPKKYQTEFKKPNPGKMPNNKDPFPVDLKIEEFEAHYPPTRIYELTTHVHGQVAAEAAMDVGNNAEKRLVKLENNMATLTRLLFRMGARMRINCLYYGGQSPFEKYKCIRCLCDDRVGDGQNVQIDQCLYCTRFEPVDGQMYECLNDLGANVSAILDDNQMSYSTIQEAVELGRVENFRTPLEKAKVDLSTITTRNKDEKDFESTWGEGLKMNWAYVPKEEQKTHINWRQSINDDGSNLQRLASYPGNEANSGANITGSSNSMRALMEANQKAMESYSGKGDATTAVYPLINAGKGIVGYRDDCANCFRGAEYNTIKKKCRESGVDSLVIASVAFATGNKDYDTIIAKYNDMANKCDTKNPAIIISAMGTCAEVFIGQRKSGSTKPDDRSSYDKVPRIDLPLTINKGGHDSATDNTSEDPNNDGVSISWDNREKWLWVDFAPRFAKRAAMLGNFQGLDWFPKACYLYCVVAPLITTSRFDEGDFAFPFFDEQFEPNGMNYASPYGMRNLGSGPKMHYGIDIGSEGGAEIHAVHDGTVVEDGNGSSWGPWHGICIDHGDGTYSRYLHCATMNVSTGQTVSKGDVIGTVGGWGESGPNSYDTHLHLEISPGDALSTKSPQDPLDYFPKFRGAVSKGDAIRPL